MGSEKINKFILNEKQDWLLDYLLNNSFHQYVNNFLYYYYED